MLKAPDKKKVNKTNLNSQSIFKSNGLTRLSLTSIKDIPAVIEFIEDDASTKKATKGPGN